MRDHDPAAWADAVDVDSALRIGICGISGEVYLHRCSAALDAADLSTAADRCQLDLWPNECAGMCGVYRFGDAEMSKERGNGRQSVPPPLRATMLRLLRLPSSRSPASRIPEIPPLRAALC